MIAVACLYCQGTAVIRYGKNESGSPRLHCKGCDKSWSPAPNSRSLSPEKAEAILRALAERTSQRGIARTFRVGRDTVRALRKKTQTG